MQEAQVAAYARLWIKPAVSRHRQQAGNMAQLVDLTQRLQTTGEGSIERYHAGETGRGVPGEANCHRTAAAAAGQKDSARLNVELMCGRGQAAGNQRFGSYDCLGRLLPIVAA